MRKKNGPDKFKGTFIMAGKKIGKDTAIDTIKKYKTEKQKSRASVSYGTTSTEKVHKHNWSLRKYEGRKECLKK